MNGTKSRTRLPMRPKGTQPKQQSPLSENQSGLERALATINAVENSVRSEATGAASTALYRVVANSILTASITTSLAFILWNENFHFSDQWVTWSLLITLILGPIAMLSSAVQVHTMNTSFRAALFFKELKINGQAVEYVDKRAAKT